MSRWAQPRIANTIEVLAEKEEASRELIRSLEHYRRSSQGERMTAHAATPCKPIGTSFSSRQLRQLYTRRAAVDELIRSVKQYRRCDLRVGRASKLFLVQVA